MYAIRIKIEERERKKIYMYVAKYRDEKKSISLIIILKIKMVDFMRSYIYYKLCVFVRVTHAL